MGELPITSTPSLTRVATTSFITQNLHEEHCLIIDVWAIRLATESNQILVFENSFISHEHTCRPHLFCRCPRVKFAVGARTANILQIIVPKIFSERKLSQEVYRQRTFLSTSHENVRILLPSRIRKRRYCHTTDGWSAEYIEQNYNCYSILNIWF